MIIEINTDTQEAYVLNEETKDWEKAFLQDMTYTATVGELITLDTRVALPFGIK